MADHAGFIERRADVHGGGQHAAAPESRRQLLVGFDAVLQRDHHRVVTNDGGQIVEDGVGLMRLDADEDEIRASAVGSTRVDRHPRDLDVANQVRLDAQPA